MTGSTSYINQDRAIASKIDLWKSDASVKQWVKEKVDDASKHQAQEGYLKDFWTALQNHPEPKRYFLLQAASVLLLFDGTQVEPLDQIASLTKHIKQLDPKLRQHIFNRLVEEFGFLKEPMNALGPLDSAHESYKNYWAMVFELGSIALLMREGLKLLQSSEGGRQLLLDVHKTMQTFGAHLRLLYASNEHDVMDEVVLFLRALSRKGDNMLRLHYSVADSLVETLSNDLLDYIKQIVHRGYVGMDNAFTHYHVLCGGHPVLKNTQKQLGSHFIYLDTELKELEVLSDADDFVSRTKKASRNAIGSLEDDIDAVRAERTFIQKTMCLAEHGYLNLGLLVANHDALLESIGALKTVSKPGWWTTWLYKDVKAELVNGFTARWQKLDGPGLGIDASHPLYLKLQAGIEETQVVVASPRKKAVGKDKDANSKAVATKNMLLFGAMDKGQHVHGDRFGNAQKLEFRAAVKKSLDERSFSVAKSNAVAQGLCCIEWKYHPMEKVLPSRTKDLRLALNNYAIEQNLLLAGAQGEEKMQAARKRHSVSLGSRGES